jgi:hypothetical protein
MARPMWASDAVVPYAVRGTYEQSASWRYAASVKGLAVPVFLALAADDYAVRLKRRIAREERREASR